MALTVKKNLPKPLTFSALGLLLALMLASGCVDLARPSSPVSGTGGMLPLSSGFGEQRLDVRETQSALYLFGDGIDLAQPIIVRMQGNEDRTWGTIVQRIEQERALIRGRAARGTAAP